MKPDDIPQGVWDAGCEAWMNADLTRMSAWKPVEHIARAIMAEREECARIAESDYNRARAGLMVATAIRSRP